MTVADDRLRDRMNDFKPYKVGQVKVPDIGWPADHKTFAARTAELCCAAGIRLEGR